MAIVCWGNLAKAADDTQRIEEAIQDYIQSHNEDPNAHMGEDYALGAHRLETVLDHPYNSVRWWHMLDLHADRITAGAMVVRGDGPYIVVQDEAYNERVRIYPEGIIINEGRVVVKNEESQTIIDPKGLLGTNIFFSSEKQKTDKQRMTGDADWQFLTPLSHGMYLNRPTPVFVWGNFSGDIFGDGANLDVVLEYPGGYWPAQNAITLFRNTAGQHNRGTLSFNHLLQLYAGANTIRLLGARSTPDAEVYVDGQFGIVTFGYMLLGNT